MEGRDIAGMVLKMRCCRIVQYTYPLIPDRLFTVVF